MKLLDFIQRLFGRRYVNLEITKQLVDKGIQPLFHSQLNNKEVKR